MTQASLSPLSALIAHLEPVFTDRRILVIGDASRSLGENLLERGARLVQILDPDARRVAHAAAHNSERRVTYAQLSESSLRDGNYDCTIVEDVEMHEDLPRLLQGVKKTLSAQGVAVLAARNEEGTTGLLGAEPGSVEYDALCDAVDDVFEGSIMLGQSAFLGYSVVQFGLDAPPEPALDNAYLGGEGEDPDFYVALAGSTEALQALGLEDMTIVQLQARRFVADNRSSELEQSRRALRRAEALEGELSTLRRQANDSELERLTREVEQRDAWIRDLEGRAESADARADDAQAQLDDLEQELQDMQKVLDATRQDADQAVLERDQKANQLRDAESNLEDALSEIAELKSSLQQAAAAPAVDGPSSALLEEELEDIKEELEDTTLLLRRREKELHEGEKAFRSNEKELQASQKELARLRLALEKSQAEAEEGRHHSVGREALEEELTSLDEKNRALSQSLKDKSAALGRLERRLVEQEKELDDLHEQLDETEELLVKARRELQENTGPTMNELERDVRGLEEQLKERGRRIVELEGQLRALESYSRTLKAELEQGAIAPNSQEEEVERLSRAIAEREADLVEAEWKISRLSQAHRQ